MMHNSFKKSLVLFLFFSLHLEAAEEEDFSHLFMRLKAIHQVSERQLNTLPAPNTSQDTYFDAKLLQQAERRIETARIQFIEKQALSDEIAESIIHHPKQAAFFNRFQTKFTELLLSYKVLSLGLVQKTPSALETFFKTLSTVASAVPLPGFKTAFELAGKLPDTLEGMLDTLKKVSVGLDGVAKGGAALPLQYDRDLTALRCVADRLTNLKIIEEEIEVTALLMMQTYCRGNLWSHLSAEGAERMADFAIKRVIRVLNKKTLEADRPLSCQLVEGVHEVSEYGSKFERSFDKLFGRKLSLHTHTSLIGRLPKDQAEEGKRNIYEWELFGRGSRPTYTAELKKLFRGR